MQHLADSPPLIATTLEGSCDRTEREADDAITAAARLVSMLKATRLAANTGDLKGLHKAQEAAHEALARVQEKVAALQTAWPLSEADEESYLASGAFTRELLDSAAQAGVNLFEQEGFLACYPSLVKVQAKERNVLIDRKPYRQIRPAHLVAHLADIQKGSPRINIGQFIETLHAVYLLLDRQGGSVVKLQDLYKTLTVLPMARRDYNVQEFARDLYLLDASGQTATREGVRFRLHTGATGAKTRSNLLIVVTREGVERTYYGIEFIA